jgi:competence protein ComEC
LPAILLAAAVMTAVDPPVVQDVSFQLSFAAIVGLVYLTPALQASSAGLARRAGVDANDGVAAFLLETSAVTLGATLATLPLIALHFERISLVAPFANLLTVPAFPLIIASSALTGVAGLVWQPLGDASGRFAWAVLSYLIDLARFFADLPAASLTIDGFGRWHTAVAYAAIAAFGAWLARRRTAADAAGIAQGASQLRPAWLLAGGLALLAAFAWWPRLDGDGGRLTVSALDVGQGDAILIETPDGHNVLVDGGPNGAALLRALGDELPFADRTLDLVVLSHTDADHLAGLIDALERYEVRQVLATPFEADTALYREWRSRVERAEVPYREARAGASVALGGGATLRVLSAGELMTGGSENDASLVLRLSYGEVDFLLTGDIEEAGERALVASGVDLRSEVLKVAHHGSQTSTSAAFVRAVGPSVAVVSAGEGNRFGHPAPAVLSRLDGSLVLRTDERGTVRLETDGTRLWLR